jgi:ABC-2 type transport system ATP-binding protein
MSKAEDSSKMEPQERKWKALTSGTRRLTARRPAPYIAGVEPPALLSTPSRMREALVLRDVSKRYANHLAVDALSLVVPPGTIYGILGPNGAGKSTTIRMAMNILGRDAGEVRILGRDPAEDRSVLRRVGYLPEERGLYRKMRVLDVITFFGRLKGMRAREARAAGERWLERMGLADWRRARIEALSKGMQQKVQFITTVLHEPDLLFLDEPASGLDPVNQEVLKETIREAAAAGRTVVLSTHNMNEAEQLCGAVCIIAQGRKVLDGGLREIKRAHLGNRWRIEFDGPYPGAREIFGTSGAFEQVVPTENGWEVTLPPGAEPRELLASLARGEEVPSRFERVYPSLHEIFVREVGTAAATPRRQEPGHA